MSAPISEQIKLDPKVLKKMGPKGKALIVIQSALVLSAMHDFEGTNIKEMCKPKAFIDTKAWKGKEKGEGGAYWQLDEKGSIFKNLYQLAKDAMTSIGELEYDNSVKNLINGFHAIPHLKGRKGRTLERDSLKGLTL